MNDYQYFLRRNEEEVRSPEGAYLTDMLSGKAVDFIQKSSEGDQAFFFLYLAYNAPHSPPPGKDGRFETFVSRSQTGESGKRSRLSGL